MVRAPGSGMIDALTPTQKIAKRIHEQAQQSLKAARRRAAIAKRLNVLASKAEWTDAQEAEWDRLVAEEVRLSVRIV